MIEAGDRVNNSSSEYTVERIGKRNGMKTVEYTNGEGWDWLKSVKLVRKEPMIKMKYGLKYDKDTDPIEVFETKKEATERINELLQDSSVSNIILFEIGKQWKIKTPTKYELEEIK